MGYALIQRCWKLFDKSWPNWAPSRANPPHETASLLRQWLALIYIALLRIRTWSLISTNITLERKRKPPLAPHSKVLLHYVIPASTTEPRGNFILQKKIRKKRGIQCIHLQLISNYSIQFLTSHKFLLDISLATQTQRLRTHNRWIVHAIMHLIIHLRAHYIDTSPTTTTICNFSRWSSSFTFSLSVFLFHRHVVKI